ncbi:transcriptional regulator [Zobellella endophytica]|uniref:Transcriptional regulator n=1 Tax=Zobellella endophytica TaxID=2116700 RepID=A0A2P7R1Q1_9GAMM|nr:MurR/RpiR family transcriptional regulator [Zobellella endophytica]PSJ44139.1 transcriptional regulator [Zobellella endophytica]
MTYEIDIVSRITEKFPELSESEKRVAQLLLDDIAAASRASIGELAREAGVSQATITRFAKAVDCRDVRDLKVRLAQSLAVGQRFIHEAPDLDGINGIYEGIKNVLELNRKVVDETAIKQAVSWLSQARQTLVVGMGGGSTIMAQELQYRLFRLGFVVSSYNDGLLCRMVASSVSAQDVFVALSLTGFTPEVVESADIARHYGAKVIAITPKGSPLAKVADLTLGLVTQETDFIYKPTASRYAMMALLDVLATELALGHKRQVRDQLRRLKLTLDAHRGGTDRQPLGD